MVAGYFYFKAKLIEPTCCLFPIEATHKGFKQAYTGLVLPIGFVEPTVPFCATCANFPRKPSAVFWLNSRAYTRARDFLNEAKRIDILIRHQYRKRRKDGTSVRYYPRAMTGQRTVFIGHQKGYVKHIPVHGGENIEYVPGLIAMAKVETCYYMPDGLESEADMERMKVHGVEIVEIIPEELEQIKIF